MTTSDLFREAKLNATEVTGFAELQIHFASGCGPCAGWARRPKPVLRAKYVDELLGKSGLQEGFRGTPAIGLPAFLGAYRHHGVGSLRRCVLPVPFSPTMTFRPSAKSSRASGKAVKFFTSSVLSTASPLVEARRPEHCMPDAGHPRS